MLSNIFQKRKKDILSKSDKSSKGHWDKKIVGLCEKINSFENFYTTSSCSGRIVLMKDQDKKSKDLFVRVYHDTVLFSKFKKDLLAFSKNINEKVKFKQEPCILHVACADFESALDLLEKARISGWKRSGIISLGGNSGRFMVELNSTEKLEFPIIEKGKILADDNFLKIVINDSNKKLKKSWEKIEKLRKLIKLNI